MKLYCSHCGTRTPEDGICTQCGFVHDLPSLTAVAFAERGSRRPSSGESSLSPDGQPETAVTCFMRAVRDCVRHPFVFFVPLLIVVLNLAIRQWAEANDPSVRSFHASGLVNLAALTRAPVDAILGQAIAAPHSLGLPVSSLDIFPLLSVSVGGSGVTELVLPVGCLIGLLWSLMNTFQWRIQLYAMRKEGIVVGPGAGRLWPVLSVLLLAATIPGGYFFQQWFFQTQFMGRMRAGGGGSLLIGSSFPPSYWASMALVAMVVVAFMVFGLSILFTCEFRTSVLRQWFYVLTRGRVIKSLLFGLAAIIGIRMVGTVADYLWQQLTNPTGVPTQTAGLETAFGFIQLIVAILVTQGLLRVIYLEISLRGPDRHTPVPQPVEQTA